MPENYVLLERTELNASAASVTFANIPQTGYTDLKIVVSSRDNRAANASDIFLNFNGVTTNLSFKRLFGDGTNAQSGSGSTGAAGIEVAANSTANTFSNIEITIPNYTSSNFKSWSADSVSENNATTAYAQLTAGLWSNTAAITSVTFTAESSSSFVANSTFSLYGIAALGTTPVIAPKAIGGNIIDFDGTYWIHTFLTSGTFTPQTSLTCDYLVVAGGGGGGRFVGGGGGAGGYRSTVGTSGGGAAAESAIVCASGTPLTVTIGAGGAGRTGGAGAGTSGNNSVFGSITSTAGGGGGGGYQNSSALAGGSGGGGNNGDINNAGAAGTSSQGYAGGTGGGSPQSTGGGGGGAGAVGLQNTTNGGAGGTGVASSITGSSVTRAGGGGGGTGNGSGCGSGGTGGGGTGGNGSNNVGGSGTVNTGSGGGGASDANGGTGGSGIVIIRYPAA